MQLRAAIATAGTKNVAGQTLAMHANQNIFLRGHIALNEGQMVLSIDV